MRKGGDLRLLFNVQFGAFAEAVDWYTVYYYCFAQGAFNVST